MGLEGDGADLTVFPETSCDAASISPWRREGRQQRSSSASSASCSHAEPSRALLTVNPKYLIAPAVYRCPSKFPAVHWKHWETVVNLHGSYSQSKCKGWIQALCFAHKVLLSLVCMVSLVAYDFSYAQNPAILPSTVWWWCSGYLILSHGFSVFCICLWEWIGLICRNSAELKFIDLCNQNCLLRGSVCFCPSWSFASVISLWCWGSRQAADCCTGVIFKSGPSHACIVFGASLHFLSWDTCFIFNDKKALFQFRVTAAASSCSVISPDPLALFILIRLTLALFEAEDLMSPLIRKWHPLWIRLAAWKVKICQWLQK